MTRPLKRSADALSRDSALSSWFCSDARRSSASNQRVNSARLTGINMASVTMSQTRRVSPLRRTELYGLPLIPSQWCVAFWQRRRSFPGVVGELYGMSGGANVGRVTNAAAPESGRRLFAGLGRGRLGRPELGQLANCGMGVAINATPAAAGRTHHSPRNNLGRDGTQSLARTGQQRVDEWRQQTTDQLHGARVLARA